ncbi:MAG: hypothetical protein ACFUZC_08820 [Chthoniobacteraceae bacterium]
MKKLLAIDYLPGDSNRNRIRKTAARQRAFSLVEIAIAIGISSVCFVSLLGVIPIGLNASTESIQQRTAAGLANAIIADLRATPATGSAVSSFYSIQFPSGQTSGTTSFFLNEDGSFNGQTVSEPLPKYRATVIVYSSPSGRTASAARVWITWPAVADLNPSALPSKYSGAFETVIGLDRN